MTDHEFVKQTLEHIGNVRVMLGEFMAALMARMIDHDTSKLEIKEQYDGFKEFTEHLRDSTYGSDEYKGFLEQMKSFLDSHYAMNRHHPEFFAHLDNGITGMSLTDLVEMLCDWKAATLRHADGDIRHSIELNQKRFGYSDELKQIFLNTIEDMEWDGKEVRK